MSHDGVHRDEMFDEDPTLAAFASDLRDAADAAPMPPVGVALAEVLEGRAPATSYPEVDGPTAPARRLVRPARLRLVLGAAVAGVVALALSAAGALPDPAQRQVARLAAHVGVHLPDGDDEDEQPVETTTTTSTSSTTTTTTTTSTTAPSAVTTPTSTEPAVVTTTVVGEDDEGGQDETDDPEDEGDGGGDGRDEGDGDDDDDEQERGGGGKPTTTKPERPEHDGTEDDDDRSGPRGGDDVGESTVDGPDDGARGLGP